MLFEILVEICMEIVPKKQHSKPEDLDCSWRNMEGSD